MFTRRRAVRLPLYARGDEGAVTRASGRVDTRDERGIFPTSPSRGAASRRPATAPRLEPSSLPVRRCRSPHRVY